MIGLLADIRPDSWNSPLFLHVLGAIVLVATVIAASVALLAPGVVDPAGLRRFAFRSLLFVGLPAYIVMRIGAEWLYSKEFGDSDDDPAWIGIGYITADIGAILFLIALIGAGIASAKSKDRLGRVAGVLVAIALVGWLVAVWAMGAKPS
jgi:phosphoglycerol transferase MdoB-like AlkP superfamily enzyme